MKRNIAKGIGAGIWRSAVYGVEFFLQKNSKERERLLELLIAHARIVPKQIPKEESSAPPKPAPVLSAVGKKRQEYQTFLCKDSHLAAAEPGSSIWKRGQWLVVMHQGKKILKLPLFRLKGIIVLAAGINISSNIIKHCAARQIPVHFLDDEGKIYATLSAARPQDIRRTSPQLKIPDGNRLFKLRLLLVQAAIKNQVNLLHHFREQDGIEAEFKQIYEETVGGMDQVLENLEAFSTDHEAGEPGEELFSLKGIAYSHYWKAVKSLLMRHIYFNGRKGRARGDLVNSLLNFGYGVLYSYVLGLTAESNLIHDILFPNKAPKRSSPLAYEFTALFRQPVVDKIIFEMVRENEKFEMSELFLSPNTRKKIALAVLRRLNDKSRWQDQGLNYAEIIGSQANNLEKFIKQGEPFTPFEEHY